MKVLNKRTDTIPRDAVYVGRPSKWGNPYNMGRYGNRENVIKLYREELEYRLKHNPKLQAEIDRELRGRDLVCWCAPLPCHADILLELANLTPQQGGGDNEQEERP